MASYPQFVIPDKFVHPEGVTGKVKVGIAGGAGFIGSHLGKRLKEAGFYVKVGDWVKNEFMQNDEFCDEFHQVDCRRADACDILCKDCLYVFNLAADMGGMGFIESNQSVLMFNNTMITFNVLEAARKAGVKRFFYASSACVYNELVQDTPENPGLKESDAWPAQPQDTYGLEKLYAEEMAKAYQRDFDIQTRIARFHNVYGPHGTWKGGREKAPAAFCRKAIASSQQLEMWGDGMQTRSFIFIEDCVDGVLRLLFSDLAEPINLGSDELISMNDFATMIMEFRKGGPLPIKHLEGPLGVRGRNSNNDFIKKKLGWAPSIPVKVGIEKTYRWIESQIDKELKAGASMSDYITSKIVVQSTESLDKLADNAPPPTTSAYPNGVTKGKH
jgi:GDP-D-mannose 3',5'-epimerase